MQKAETLEKTLMLGKMEGKRRRGRHRTRWLDSITDSMEVTLSKLQESGQKSLACCSPCCAQSLSRVRLFLTPWTIAHQALLSMGILQARILEWVAMPSLQGIFPTQGSNPGLLHFRQILYHLSHQGSPWTLEWVAYPLSRGPSQPRDQTRLSCIAGGFFISWATREALQTMGSQRVTHWTTTTFSITQGGQAYKKKDAGVLLPKIVKQGRKWAVYIRKVNY